LFCAVAGVDMASVKADRAAAAARRMIEIIR